MTDKNDMITAEFISQEIARGKKYYLLVLTLGESMRNNRTLLDQLQAGHLAHLFKLRSAGKLVLSGPVLGESNLRGIGIFNAFSLEEVEGYVAGDPLIKGGFLKAEIYPWMGLPGDSLP